MCIRSEENSSGWYLKNSEEHLLEGVKATDKSLSTNKE